MNVPKPEIIVVFGRGLACVIERGQEKEGKGRFDRHGPTVRYADHGYTPEDLLKAYKHVGTWTWAEDTRLLSEAEATEAIQREQREAAARRVNCTTPGCWCIPFLTR